MAADARRCWLAATVVATLVPIAALPLFAPTAAQRPAAGLGWLLFVGSSMHVASTGWFYSVREVRQHMQQHRLRFLVVPALLVTGGAVAALTLPPRGMSLVLLALLGWQFVHFQKQNLGVTALAATSYRVATPSRGERRTLSLAAGGVVLGLVGRPQLLQVALVPHVPGLFPAGALVFAFAVAAGLVQLARRPAAQRPAPYVLVWCTSLLFFTPVWLFTSPYAAVAGLTIAHGLQYLLLVGLVAGGAPRGRARTISVIVLLDVAVLAGLAVNRMSHLHGADAAGRALYGAYLGITAAHFVTDAGLWRLRDAFPRRFLTRRLPFLLAPAATTRELAAAP